MSEATKKRDVRKQKSRDSVRGVKAAIAAKRMLDALGGVSVGVEVVPGVWIFTKDVIAVCESLLAQGKATKTYRDALVEIDALLKGQLPITHQAKEIAREALKKGSSQ